MRALASCNPGVAQGLAAERLFVEDKLLPALRLLCSVRAAGVAGVGEARRRACLDASDALDRLRIFTQLSKVLGFFSDVAFFEISERSAEVGRQLGGWLKAARGPWSRGTGGTL